MRYTLRSLFRRWKVRIAYLLARDHVAIRGRDEPVRPRLVLLETRTTPSGLSSLLASFNAGGSVTTTHVADPNNSGTGVAVTNTPATAALTFTASGTAGAITVNSRVFADANRNGVLDPGEAGVANAQVQLFDATGTLLGTAISDANGNFSFSSVAGSSSTNAVYNTPLQSGALYQLRAQSNAAPVIGLIVQPASGGTTTSLTRALTRGPSSATIGGLVFTDTNGNGQLDGAETGVGNVTVNLFDNTNTFVNSTTTANDGTYSFIGVSQGTYTIVFDSTTLPTGSVFTTEHAAGSNVNNDSDADPTTGKTDPITVASGDVVNNIYAGIYTPVVIGDFAWNDANGNGIQDSGEGGQAGVVVNLLDNNGNVVQTQTTGGNGLYLFSAAPGTYQVEFVAPPGTNFSPKGQGVDPTLDSDADPVTGRTALIAFNSGDFNTDLDAGITSVAPATGSIGDFVFFDQNQNGIQDPGEIGVPNQVVNLLDGTGNFISTTTTDSVGHYFFTGLAAGNYIVEVVTSPAGWFFSPPHQGPDPKADSDITSSVGGTGRTGVITLAAGQANFDVDAGLTKPTTALLGDFVFLDTNNNGIQDPGEAGVANVTVNLLDSNGVFVSTTSTDANGKYLFLNVAPGNYQVEFIAPAGFNFTKQDQGADDTIDSDADPVTGRTAVFTLVANQQDLTRDAGLTQAPPPLGAIGDFVFFDQNLNGIQDPGDFGVPNQVVNLLDGSGNFIATTKTDSFGKYLFTGLAAGNYIIEVVTSPAGWFFSPPHQGPDPKADSDITSSVGGTGRTSVITLAAGQNDFDEDAGLTKPTAALLGDFVWNDLNCNGIQDAGEPGVANVTVNVLDSGNVLVATTTTDVNGKYLVSGLTPGSYHVMFVLPNGFVFTKQHQGADITVDSDADPVTGNTQTVTLAAGDANMTLDAGLCAVAAIGDFVWNDLNCNGIQDAGEPGLQGVTVMLLDANGNMVATQKTDATGHYLFSNLAPANYHVKFTAPAGFTFSPQNQGANDQIDSDANPATGVTGTYMLMPGQTDLSADAGLCMPMAPAVSSIRGNVYHDLNNDGIQQPNEPGIAGASLTLTGRENTGALVRREVFSAPDGTYEFTGLRPGDYVVTEGQPPNYLTGKNRAGTQGGLAGLVGDDVIRDILIPAGVDASDYDFGELLNGQSPSKEDLLASSTGATGGRTPTLADQARAVPTSPTYGNAVAATQLADPSFSRFVVTASDAGSLPLVRVFDFGSGVNKFTIMAYDPSFRGGVRVAVGDVTGDGVPDIITAAGEGGGPHIKVFDGVTGALVSQFFAYDASFTGGVYIAVGDVNGDGVDEIITGAGEGGGPHVKVFTESGSLVRQFFAYDASFTGGVRVAAGDVNGDGLADIITGAGPGGGPHVKVFSGNAAQGLLSQAFVYDAGFTGGVYVAAGDVNGDGKAEVITGPGAGVPHPVRILNGLTFTEMYSRFVYGQTYTGGVRVGALDIDGDGLAEVITSPGAGLPEFVRIIHVSHAANLEFFLASDPTVLSGVFVAGGK